MSDCVNGCRAPADSPYRHEAAVYCRQCMTELRRAAALLSLDRADLRRRAEAAERALAEMRGRWEAAEARIAELEGSKNADPDSRDVVTVNQALAKGRLPGV